MEERSDMCEFRCGNLRERNYLEVPGLDGMVILRSIFGKLFEGPWTESSRLKLWRFGVNL
jgi:hypothetical protein